MCVGFLHFSGEGATHASTSFAALYPDGMRGAACRSIRTAQQVHHMSHQLSTLPVARSYTVPSSATSTAVAGQGAGKYEHQRGMGNQGPAAGTSAAPRPPHPSKRPTQPLLHAATACQLKLPASTVQPTCRLALHAQQGGVRQRVLVCGRVGIRGVDRVFHLQGQQNLCISLDGCPLPWRQQAAPASWLACSHPMHSTNAALNTGGACARPLTLCRQTVRCCCSSPLHSARWQPAVAM